MKRMAGCATTSGPAPTRLAMAALLLAACHSVHAARDRREWLQIVPYVGFGTSTRGEAVGRVVEPLPLGKADSAWGRFRNNLKRLMTDEKEGVLVVVRVGSATAQGRTNDEGFYHIRVPLRPGTAIKDGFVEGQASLGPSKKYRAKPVATRFVAPTKASRFGVISDIDDTVLVTHVLETAKMLRSAALGDAHTRLAFPGAPELYQALRDGHGNEHNPFFYISGSPWNLYDILATAFAKLGIPAGYWRLRDIGLGSDADPLFSMRAFKRPNILHVLDTYPNMRFVLVGDSGQKDAEIYADIATHARYRDRIAAVYIRDVSPITDTDRRKELAALADRVGKHFVVFGNSWLAARHAASIGLIPQAAVEPVRKACALSGALGRKPATKYPIVLVHGLLGFSQIGIDDFGALTYFRNIRPYLEKRGFRVCAPALGMTDGVAVRAQQLKDAINRFTSGRVNLIAHSMGGLDSRYMITHLGMADRVASLTTIATPHRGSSFADWGIEHAGSSAPLLRALGIGTQAFYDLTTDACRKFNDHTPNAPGVRYYSYSGTQRRKHVYGGLRFSYDIVMKREGPNDGLVSQTSARWGRYLGNVDADHLNLVGWKFFWEFREKFDAKAFYLGIARMLEAEGM